MFFCLCYFIDHKLDQLIIKEVHAKIVFLWRIVAYTSFRILVYLVFR